MNERHFGTLPLHKVFFAMAIPSMVSMMFSSLYSIVDGMFVGYFIGSEALAAISITLPVIVIAYAIPNMLAVGSSVKVGIALGNEDSHAASRLFTVTVLLQVVLGTFFAILGYVFLFPILSYMIEDPELAAMSHRYLLIFFLAMPISMQLFSLDNFLRAVGKSKLSMWVNIIVSLFNIVLDALFIGVMGLGLEYAAIASVLSQIIGAGVCFWPFLMRKVTLQLVRPSTSIRELYEIARNGVPELIGVTSFSLLTLGFNYYLMQFKGTDAVAAYVIVLYIDNIIFALFYGMLDAIQPVVSYNFGAKLYTRLRGLFRLEIIFTFSLMYVFMVLLFFFPDAFISLFVKESEPNVAELAKLGLFFYLPNYLYAGFNHVLANFVTAIEQPKWGTLLTSLYGIIVPLSLMVILSYFFDLYGLFAVLPVGHFLVLLPSWIIWGKTKALLNPDSEPAAV